MNTKNTCFILFITILLVGCVKDKVTEEVIIETDPYVGTDCTKEWQDLGDYSINDSAFQYFPYDTFTGKAIVFIDSLGNEKRFIYDTVFHDFLQWGGEKPCPSNSALTERFQWKYESRTFLFQDDRDPYIWRMGIRSVPQFANFPPMETIDALYVQMWNEGEASFTNRFLNEVGNQLVPAYAGNYFDSVDLLGKTFNKVHYRTFKYYGITNHVYFSDELGLIGFVGQVDEVFWRWERFEY